MSIKMVGIDHERASIEYRECVSFHRHEAIKALQYIRKEYEVSGAILIATCNRTELYLSIEEEEEISPFDVLCQVKQLDSEQFRILATQREEVEVVEHLLEVSCGLKSKVFGEDQIISQVKDALALAREAETTDQVLEKLFLTAITAAKKVKTEVRLTAVNSSIIAPVLQVLHKKYDSLRGIPCLVIGNGAIGCLAAERMLEEGCDVTMTVRRYKTRDVVLPDGVQVIDYADRYEYLSKFDLIISGTLSPHHTIRYEEAVPCFMDGVSRILIDLAVPRDISQRLGELDTITLFNIDSLGGMSTDEIDNESVKKAKEILKEYEEEFNRWNSFRRFIPLIQTVARTSSIDIIKRTQKPMKRIVDNVAQRVEIEEEIKKASEKVIANLLYSLRENVGKEHWQDCLFAIEEGVVGKE